MEFFHNLLMCLGRVFMGILFLWAAGEKILDWKGTISYMQSKNLRYLPILLFIVVFLQIVGGLSIALGYHTHVGAMLLIVFTIAATVKMHDFWNIVGQERSIEKTMFMKDVAIVGGLLFIFLFGPGHFSIDGR